jgi:hypothetical protein
MEHDSLECLQGSSGRKDQLEVEDQFVVHLHGPELQTTMPPCRQLTPSSSIYSIILDDSVGASGGYDVVPPDLTRAAKDSPYMHPNI